MQHHLRVPGRPRREVQRSSGRPRASAPASGAESVARCESMPSQSSHPAPGRRPRRRPSVRSVGHVSRASSTLSRSLGIGDRRDRPRPPDPVRDVARRQQRRPGHRHRAELDAAEQRRSCHSGIRGSITNTRSPLLDAVRGEDVRSTVRGASQVGEREPHRDLPAGLGGEEREPPGDTRAPNVDDVAHVVEALGDLETEGPPRLGRSRSCSATRPSQPSSGVTEATLGRQPPTTGGRRSRPRRAGRAVSPRGQTETGTETWMETCDGDGCAPSSSAISVCACAVAACAAAISVWYVARSPARQRGLGRGEVLGRLIEECLDLSARSSPSEPRLRSREERLLAERIGQGLLGACCRSRSP